MNTPSSPAADLLKTSLFERLSDFRFALQFGSGVMGFDLALRIFHSMALADIRLNSSQVSAGTILIYTVGCLFFFALFVPVLKSLVCRIISPITYLAYRKRNENWPDDNWVSCSKATQYAWSNKDDMLLKHVADIEATGKRVYEWDNLNFGFSIILLASLWCEGPILGWPWLAQQKPEIIQMVRAVFSIFAFWRFVESLAPCSNFAYHVYVPGHPLAKEQAAAREKARREKLGDWHSQEE